MTHHNNSRTAFRGSLLGVEYDDPATFEKVARGLGWRPGQGRSGTSWREGTEVRVTLTTPHHGPGQVRGQVWCRHEQRGYVWLALEDGRYVSTHCHSGHVTDVNGATLGRVG